MKLSLLLEALGIREGFAETDITDLVYDSRKAGPGCAESGRLKKFLEGVQ